MKHKTNQQKKNWLTLIELLVALVIIGIVVIGAISMHHAAHGWVNKVRQETIAINLAREGMESVYARRDANRLLYPAEKDMYRLCKNNLCHTAATAAVTWLQGGSAEKPYLWYSVLYSGSSNKNIELVLNGISLENLEDSIKTWSTLLSWSDFMNAKIPAGWSYYRSILGQGLYLKDTTQEGWEPLSCINGSTSWCRDTRAKEFRFCSKVEYEWLWAWNGNVILCGAITNYLE